MAELGVVVAPRGAATAAFWDLANRLRQDAGLRVTVWHSAALEAYLVPPLSASPLNCNLHVLVPSRDAVDGTLETILVFFQSALWAAMGPDTIYEYLVAPASDGDCVLTLVVCGAVVGDCRLSTVAIPSHGGRVILPDCDAFDMPVVDLNYMVGWWGRYARSPMAEYRFKLKNEQRMALLRAARTAHMLRDRPGDIVVCPHADAAPESFVLPPAVVTVVTQTQTEAATGTHDPCAVATTKPLLFFTLPDAKALIARNVVPLHTVFAQDYAERFKGVKRPSFPAMRKLSTPKEVVLSMALRATFDNFVALLSLAIMLLTDKHITLSPSRFFAVPVLDASVCGGITYGDCVNLLRRMCAAETQASEPAQILWRGLLAALQDDVKASLIVAMLETVAREGIRPAMTYSNIVRAALT